MNRICTSLGVAGLLAMLITPASAQERHGMMAQQAESDHSCPMMEPMTQIGAFAPAALLQRKDLLGLTADQLGRLQVLSREVESAHATAADLIEAGRAQLDLAWQADRPDPKAVQDRAGLIIQAHHDAHLAMLGTAAQAKGLLTPEQRGRVLGWLDARQMMRQQGTPQGGQERRHHQR